METPQLIGGFKQRFESFVMKYRVLQQENQYLKSTNEKLLLRIKEKEKEIKAIHNTNKINELASAFVYKSDGVQGAKQSINRIVREIDSCIALLNR